MGLVDDLLDAAKQISSDVTDAFESKNYSNLKNSIGYRVMTAGDKFGREAALAAKKNKEERDAQEKKAPKRQSLSKTTQFFLVLTRLGRLTRQMASIHCPVT